ncbi:hypothetical protein CWE13_00895 [Aliidiomarina shirensis]|uniref:Uncharacterized protein n=1 Tax=Aliidiomarina shirensis TaxID=1048642 RepID=A0A432WWV3_9GAMM|nr:hypothetical protein [Aliidiomarina shirensis]RUO38239.1 hypothetical protein CWE13_00895 [Aliidiomarina shirensis]
MVNKTGQPDIFNPVGFDSQFAELCNALYAAELLQLSGMASDHPQAEDIRLLRRRLGSLSYYVQRAAHALLVSAAKPEHPLQLDVHSGNWLAKQKTTPPKRNISQTSSSNQKKLAEWLASSAKLALPLPVYVESAGTIRIALDSIDEVDWDNKCLHLNQWGWFDFHGFSQSDENANIQLQLLKPDKANMTAACCGHQWNAKGRLQPYPLGLRTLLLSATVVWPKFTSVDKLPF